MRTMTPSSTDPNAAEQVQVGDGATYRIGSDCYAHTIIGIRGKARKIVTIQRDHERMVEGHGLSETQRYEYTPNPDGATMEVTFHAGAWRRRGDRYSVVTLGHRRTYRDPAF